MAQAELSRVEQAPPDEDPPTYKIGWNPFGWRRKRRAYADAMVSWLERRTRYAVGSILSAASPERTQRAIAGIMAATRSISLTSTGFARLTILTARLTSIVGLLTLVTPLVAPFIVAPPNLGVWWRILAAVVGFVLYLAWTVLILLVVGILPRSLGGGRQSHPRALVLSVDLPLGPATWIVVLTIIPAVFAFAPARVHAPHWVSAGWFHLSLLGFATACGVSALVGFAIQVTRRLAWAFAIARVNRKMPEQHAVDRLSGVATYLCGFYADPADTFDARIQYVDSLEEIADDFERLWPRFIVAEHRPRARAVIQEWASRVAAAIRAQQLPLLQGVPLRSVGVDLMDVVARLVAREAFPETPTRTHRDRYRSISRRIGRYVGAGALLVLAVVLIALAAWQPGLPTWLNHWSGQLSALVGVPAELRPGVLGAAVAVFGLFVRVVAPQSGPEGTGRVT